MSSDSLRRRLEALNRGPLPSGAKVLDAIVAPRAKQPRGKRSARRKPAGEPRVVPPQPGLLRSGEAIACESGECLRIRLPLDALWPSGPQLVAARMEFLQGRVPADRQTDDAGAAMHEDFLHLVAALPDRLLLLDLETCGLAGAALFLVGLLRTIDGRPTVELLLARDYSEERAVLECLWQVVARHDVLVTFNGKSFDWPMVLDRTARHRLERVPTATTRAAAEAASLVHVDLLHHARRRWRGALPDCRLQTLEQYVCRRARQGDIPGNQIPAAYADFVRTGFEREMDAILYHNALDLVTLLDLALRLAA